MQPGVCVSCAGQESHLVVYVCSKAVSMHVLSSLEYSAPVWMSSEESHLGLLNSIVHSAERSSLGLGRKGMPCVCSIRLITEWITLWMSINFVAARNIRALAALGELALVIPHCITDQFRQLFLIAAACLRNLLPSAVFSVAPLALLRALCLLRHSAEDLAWFFLFISVSFCCFIACLVTWFWAVWIYRCIPFTSSVCRVVLINNNVTKTCSCN